MQETSCSFLYFHRTLLAAALKDLASRPAEARKLPLLVAAFADAHQLLSRTTLDPAAAHRVIYSSLYTVQNKTCFCHLEAAFSKKVTMTALYKAKCC